MKVREAKSEMNLRADEAYEWASMKLADTPAVRGGAVRNVDNTTRK